MHSARTRKAAPMGSNKISSVSRPQPSSRSRTTASAANASSIAATAARSVPPPRSSDIQAQTVPASSSAPSPPHSSGSQPFHRLSTYSPSHTKVCHTFYYSSSGLSSPILFS